jgi:hypothetical protein
MDLRYSLVSDRSVDEPAGGKLEVLAGNDTVISADISALKEAWQKPLRW